MIIDSYEMRLLVMGGRVERRRAYVECNTYTAKVVAAFITLLSVDNQYVVDQISFSAAKSQKMFAFSQSFC